MTELYSFQTEDVKRIDHFKGRCLLALEMGLGKTVEALTWIKQHQEARPVIVVCPASLKWQWQRETQRHIGMEATVIEGRKTFQPKQRIVIVNYDILGAWLDTLRSLNPQLVICDESAALKNWKARRTKWVERLCRNVPYILCLSGTPIMNRPVELWTTLRLLKANTGHDWQSFANTFCAPRWTPWGIKYDGASNLKELRSILRKSCMIRRKKEDVLKDLPAQSRHVILLPLDDPTNEYHQAEKDFINWLRKTSKIKADKARKAQRLVQMGYLKRLAGKLKLPAVIEWVGSFLEQTKEKLVVFAVHKPVIDRLRDRYPHDSVVIDGETTSRDRQRAVDQFQDKRTRILIGNLQAAGTGLNLTAASTALFCELGWSPGEHVQAQGRLHRIGQEQKVSYFYALAKGTIEESLCRLIQTKAKILEAVLDGRSTNGDMTSILDQLELALLKGPKQ